MKRFTVLLPIISAAFCLLSISRSQQSPVNPQRMPTKNNTLIVYLSRTGNTKAIAEIIQQKVGGRIVALELQTPVVDRKEMDSTWRSKTPGKKQLRKVESWLKTIGMLK